jgi:hypothetical protein
VSLFFVIFIGGCSGAKLASTFSQMDIEIDGDIGDWEQLPAYTQRDGIRLSIANDREYLYILFVTSQRDIARQVLMRGMTLWFDPNGGTKRTIGLAYPLGILEPGMRDIERPDRLEMRQDVMNRSLNEFEFYGPQEHDRLRVAKTQGKGIEVEVNDERSLFIYEAKIPLIFSARQPYAIEASPGSAVGLAIEIGDREMFSRRTDGMGGERPGGFPGGGRGRMPGGGGQRPAGMQGTQFEPIEITVQLAE